MRVVHERGSLEEAVSAARSEAGAAFGNDAIFMERYELCLIARNPPNTIDAGFYIDQSISRSKFSATDTATTSISSSATAVFSANTKRLSSLLRP